MDIVTRNNYARLFQGVLQDISYASSGSQVAAIFDRTYMPALLVEDGKQIFHSFTLAQNSSQALQLPQLYDQANKLYIAVQTDGRAKVAWDSPTHGSSQAVLLEATSSDADGVHKALWCYQGDVSAVTVSIPPTAQGGATTEVQVFMYEIPDLEVYSSYYDKQIGLGITQQL